MAKIFLAPLDSRWRLVHDWTPSQMFLNDHDNQETMTGDTFSSFYQRYNKGDPNPGHGKPDYEDWNRRFDAARKESIASYGFDGVMPKGTIIQIERYHVSRSGENQITIKVLLSPSKFLTPKKQKGVMRGAGRLYFRLDDFNTLPELEEFTDVLS